MIRRSARNVNRKSTEPDYEEKSASSDSEVEQISSTRARKRNLRNIRLEPVSSEEISPEKKRKNKAHKIISTDDDIENEKPVKKATKKKPTVKAEPLSDRNTEESAESDNEGKSPEMKRQRRKTPKQRPANQPTISQFLSPKSRATVKTEPATPSSSKVEESTATEDEEAPARGQTGLSEYEKQILKNIEERKKMFQMIVGDAKADFMKSVAPVVEAAKEKTKPTHRGFKRKSEPEYVKPFCK